MSLHYRATPCGHCGEGAALEASCPDCGRLICVACQGPERCATPRPRRHELPAGMRVIGLEKAGKAALAVSKRGMLRTYDLAARDVLSFPGGGSTAPERLAADQRRPRMLLLEGGQCVANFLLEDEWGRLQWRRKGQFTRVWSPKTAFLATQRTLCSPRRILVDSDESVIFVCGEAGDTHPRTFAYPLDGGSRPHQDAFMTTPGLVCHAARVGTDHALLATSDCIVVFELGSGRRLDVLFTELRWLGAAGGRFVLAAKHVVRRGTVSSSGGLELDASWRLGLGEATCSELPAEGSLTADGSILALLGESRRRVLVVDLEGERLLPPVKLEADVDALRLVEGRRLLIATQDGVITEYWLRTLAATEGHGAG